MSGSINDIVAVYVPAFVAVLPVIVYLSPAAVTPVCSLPVYVKPVVAIGTVTFPFVTVIADVAVAVLSFDDVAVIVAVPTPIAVTSPVWLFTVATDSSELVYVTSP